MTTVLDITSAAMRKIGVLGAGEAAEGQEAADALEALNFMLSAWKLEGVDIGHTELALTDGFPLADEFREGTVYMLASRLSPDYAVPASFDPDAWFDGIRAAYLVIPEAEMPKALSRMPSQHWPQPRVR